MKLSNVTWLVTATCWIMWVGNLPYCRGQSDSVPEAWSWQRVPGETIALHGRGGVVWQFNFGRRLTKPYFHPVGLPGQKPLTVSRPPDHAWHYGLWFSWKFINGVNYWEEPEPTGLPEGRTSWGEVNADLRADGSASVSMELTYGVPPEDPVLHEQRQIAICPPRADGSYDIDWTSIFRAGSERVVLDCTPIPPHPRGKPWGGYAGLSIRLSPALKERQVFTSAGMAPFQADGVHRSRGPGCDYQGVLDDRTCGIAILDHPGNPRYPSPWYAIRSQMSYLNAALLTHEPLPMDAEETLTLKYRICVHPARWDAGAIDAAWRRAAEASFPDTDL